MLLKFKRKFLLVNAVIILGYATGLHADECGVLRYLANKSNGVAITGNTCGVIDDIALGSEFNLKPGARLWFKSQTGIDAKKMQGICQNRSPDPINISVNSGKLPWIKPSDLVLCDSWTDNKMNCRTSKNGQNALSCIIAAISSESGAKMPERTTSVRMRSITTPGEADKSELLQSGVETEKEQIVLAMQPDIGLCKAINPTNTPIKITWLVEKNGQVNTIIPTTNGSSMQSNTDKQLIDCLTAVIRDFTYPLASEAVWLSHQF
ncbi:MAG: hypothetical protein Q8N96_03250 [Methylovulum sp.]|nr:hypothetical protein [Methylovulum sp.]